MGAKDLNKARELYELFASACEQANWKPYIPHRNTDPRLASDISAAAVALRDTEELRRCDAIIIYLGEPSLGVGAELVLAMQQKKPILAVYEKSKLVSRFAIGLLEHYPKAYIFQYTSVEEATQKIRQFLPSIAQNQYGAKNDAC